jgi:diaminohydroxyphosphoribosylaminopyrimidine deaminase / 5-amino-6-(5-phosphoribosylamino)uracil reductase
MISDERFMRVALAQAQRGVGQCHPNPSVGAVVVTGEQIVATAHTAAGGRPHAEPLALERAGSHTRGATLYVSLEPCAHTGQTPPCTQAIIEAGIRTVVVATTDPDPRVAGKGIAQLKAAGIEVREGVLQHEARTLNRGFFTLIEQGRPLVALKIATSLDGKIARHGTHTPEERWLTSPYARRHVHALRARFDAILTGSGTVLTDNPQLNVRLAGLENQSPARFVADRRERVNAKHAIMPATLLREASVQEMVHTLAAKGITRLLVEAGQQLSSAFLKAGLVDELYWYRAPLVLGDGLSVFTPEVHEAKALASLKHTATHTLSPDQLDVFTRKENA